MRYYLPIGNYVEVDPDTPLAVTEAIRAEAQGWVPSVSLEDYMEGVQQRWQIQTGHRVRIDSVEHFVADLLATGFLKTEPPARR